MQAPGHVNRRETLRALSGASLLSLAPASCSSSQTKLKRLAARAASINPIDPELSQDGYGPTIDAVVTPLGESGTQAYQQYHAVEFPHLFTLYGGNLHLRYDDWQAICVSYPDGHAAPNSGRVAFCTDAANFDIIVGVSETASYRVLVDDLYVSRVGTLTKRKVGGARDFINIALRAPSSAKSLRRIDVEIFSPEGAFGGVAVPPHATLAPVTTADRYRIACFGDSFSAGTGCLNQNDAWNVVAGYLLGGVSLDMAQIALGGTGFLCRGASWKASDHIADLKSRQFDELWIALGTNDAAYPAPSIVAAALDFFQKTRLILPDEPIVVLGIPRDDSDRAAAAEQAIARAFHMWDDQRSAWIPFQTPHQKLFTGSVTGGGNFVAELYGGGIDGRDNTHPNRLGHRHWGGVVASKRRDLSFA